MEQVESGALSDADRELVAAMAAARKQRRTRIAGGIAFAFVAAFFAIHVEWQDRTVGLPLASSYFAAYSLAPLLLASIVAAVACVFRGRSWFRFFVAFCVVSALALPSQISKLAKYDKETLRALPAR